jgi:glycosyltransferase involved in cell wall biosynthesis
MPARLFYKHLSTCFGLPEELYKMTINPKVSIIISAKNEEEHIAGTISSMLENTGYENFEIIAINDGSIDKTEAILANFKSPKVKTIKAKGIGTAKARNFGSRYAKGDLLIFSDAHITVSPGWLERIVEINNNMTFDILSVPIAADERGVGKKDYVGYGQTLNNRLEMRWINRKPATFQEVPVAPGGFIIYKSPVFSSLQGYDSGFNTWGFEDIEISIRAWLMGFSTKIIPDMSVSHYFRAASPFKVSMVEYLYNTIRTGYLHFRTERYEKLKNILNETFEVSGYNGRKSMEILMQQLEEANAAKLREIYINTRKYSDDWYFDKFNINF